jgi:hypothetical protein
MELQHINVKLYLEHSDQLDLGEFIPIFHNWIQGQVCKELLIDVADYRHVYAGPGVVLIGDEGDYSLDNADNRLGLRYNRKKVLPGTNRDRFAQALRASLEACERLESDERVNGNVHFGRRELKLFVNDRMLAPNVDETYAAVKGELREFFKDALGTDDFVMRPEADRRRLFGVEVQVAGDLDPAWMLNRLLRLQSYEWFLPKQESQG